MPASRANLIACTRNVLTVMKTSWAVPQMLTTVMAFTPSEANGFPLWAFRLAIEKKIWNHFFCYDDSLTYINYCRTAEMAV